jgi:hypothetical protein
MAEEKSEKKGLTIFEQMMLFLFLIYFLSLLWYRGQDFLVYYHGSGYGSLWAALVAYFLTHIAPFLKLLALIIVALAIFGIVHAYMNISKIKKEEKAIYGPKVVEATEEPMQKNDKWERVIAHLNSASASDQKLAVIEADIMLDDLLKAQGYHGDSLGERLRSVEKSDFLTLDNAWEAHRVRNQIAHQGGDFPLSEREARRAVALYESVFKEFKII